MKHAKKLAGLLLALVMVLSMSVTVFAAGETGTITIDNAVKDQTYTIYEILKLGSYDAASNAYSYVATDAWSSFIDSNAIKDVYVKVDDQGYVAWIETASAADFAKAAQKYAKDNSIGNQGATQATDSTVTFDNLELGYYLVDTTLGTLCSLDTTNSTVTIKEKNVEPTNEKKVEEDSTGNYGGVNDADIGQTVKFQSTITVPANVNNENNTTTAGAQNYVFHDKMSIGLTYTGVTGITLNSNTVPDSNYTVNENAVVGGEGNKNGSKLSYGEEGKTETKPSETYTWSFDVLKYGNGDKNKVLEGAQFVLLNKEKTKVATIVNGKLTGWVDVPAAGTDGTNTWPANTTLTTDAQGKINIAGLDADTYYLRETQAPAGYNILNTDVEVKIEPNTGNDGKTLTLNSVTAEIENKSGTELPSTGGMGTTIFYVIGSILLIGAAVLLITKKRMSAEK